MSIEQEAASIADQICGCATREQHRRDVALIVDALRQAEARAFERAAVAMENLAPFLIRDDIVAAIRAMKEQGSVTERNESMCPYCGGPGKELTDKHGTPVTLIDHTPECRFMREGLIGKIEPWVPEKGQGDV